MAVMESRRAASELPTIVETLRWRASHEAERICCSFVSEDEAPARWTYADLDLRARSVAALLQARGVERAVLLYPAGLSFVAAMLGCLYAGTIAVPAPLPRPSRSGRRLESILSDAAPTAVLCSSSVASEREQLAEQAPSAAALKWFETDELSTDRAEPWQPTRRVVDDVAYLQYTSGATGAPKGAMVTHGGLVANSHYIAKRFEHTPDSRVLTWLPHFHDMGLVGGILHPLHWGFPIVLMAPLPAIQQPIRWLRAIDEEGATTSGAPNFAYEACLRRISAEDREGLDLSRWDVAFNGSEVVGAQTIERFTEFFAPCGFRREAFFPCYGMAEATLFVTGGPKTTAPRFHDGTRGRQRAGAGRERLVGCGTTDPDFEVAIVDPVSGVRVAPGAIGEVWIAGPSVAKGYWSEPEDVSSAFGARIEGSPGRYLRTGDPGFVEGGELYITGRIKDIVIIAGVNHSAEDLERSIVDAHAWLAPGCCAAFPVRVDGEERLAVAVELDREHWKRLATKRAPTVERGWKGLTPEQRSPQDGPSVQTISGDVRAALVREHGISAASIMLLPSGALPRTSSGKIQRHACYEKFESGRLTPQSHPSPAAAWVARS